MDSEWVPVPKVPTEAMKEAGDYSKWNYDDADDIFRAMLAAAPPPPAEQASGEHVEMLREIRLAYGDAPNHFTAEKAALDHAIAALSQRLVVDEAMVERALSARAGSWSVRELFSDEDEAPEIMRIALTTALAPQQPEKGETP